MKSNKAELVPPSISWHRLFGLLLADYLTGSPFEVELEKDLSQKKQLLDVVIIRKRAGVMDRPMPDGLQELTDHNLITFKSFRESLDDWALKELTGHYVNYRKQEADETGVMPVEKHFSLFAISARYPRELFKAVPFEQINEGVYDCKRGSDRIRVIVANQLSETEHNSLLHLFSAVRNRVEYGRQHHVQLQTTTSTIVDKVFQLYRTEGSAMPYTLEDFKREVEPYYMAKALENASPEDLIREMLKKHSASELQTLLQKQSRIKPIKPKKKRKKADS